MAVNRLYNPRVQFVDSNGNPANNYRLFFYAAGTSTKQNTYNSSAGTTANSNPITLNSLGQPAVEIWATAGLRYKIGLAAPGSDDPPSTFIWTEDNCAGIDADVGLLATSVSNLLTQVGSYDGQPMDLQGYYAIGDGGGGPLYWSASSTATHDGGLVFKPTAISGAGRWLRIPKTPGAVYALDFGVKTDGTDSYSALNTAGSITNTILILPSGTVNYGTNWTPACSAIIGSGELASVLKPGAAVTKALSIGGSNYPTLLRDFRITGTLTTGAKGLILGDAAVWSGRFEGLYIDGFTGTNAVGLQIKDALKSNGSRITVQQNTTGVLVQGSGTGDPTTISLTNLTVGNSTGVGMKVLNAEEIVLDTPVFESNQSEGLLVQPTGTDFVNHFVVRNPYFEDNNISGGSSTYQAKIDATGTSSVVRYTQYGGLFAKATSTAKSLLLTGNGIDQFLLDDVFPSNETASIAISNGARGRIANWPQDLVYATVVSDTARTASAPTQGAEAIAASWINWTPTFSSSVGDAATTFNGAVTISVARFKVMGKMIHIQLTWSATLKAVTPSYIGLTLPGSLSLSNPNEFADGTAIDNAAYEVGHFRGGAIANVFQQFRQQFGNYTSAGSVGGFFNGWMELQA